jgi:hypothetical protein
MKNKRIIEYANDVQLARKDRQERASRWQAPFIPLATVETMNYEL